jgi:hypothetical protein
MYTGSVYVGVNELGNSGLGHGFVGFGTSRCLIPRFDGVILSMGWKEALWNKFVTEAPRPRTLSEQQYSDRKLRSRS